MAALKYHGPEVVRLRKIQPFWIGDERVGTESKHISVRESGAILKRNAVVYFGGDGGQRVPGRWKLIGTLKSKGYTQAAYITALGEAGYEIECQTVTLEGA